MKTLKKCFLYTSFPIFRALFPCGDAMVCIIDDREDVWNFSANVVQVKPYMFFDGTADINAPSGLEKTKANSKDLKRKSKVIKIPKKNSPKNEKKEIRVENTTKNEGEKKVYGEKNISDEAPQDAAAGKEPNLITIIHTQAWHNVPVLTCFVFLPSSGPFISSRSGLIFLDGGGGG